MRILVLNAGSSSQKACSYEIGNSLPPDPPQPTWEGKIQLDGDQAEIRAKNSQGIQTEEQVSVRPDKGDASLGQLLGNLWSGNAQAAGAPASIDVAAHRIVNG